MNVKQLIEKYENILKKSVPFTVVNIHGVLRDLKQLDEPQKVVVPQFVADYIEFAKKHDWNLRDVFLDVGCDDPFGSDVFNWLYKKRNNIDVLARAWLDSYEVEKEPKYTVKIKATKHYFTKDGNGRIYFSLKYESAFTKIELEKVNLGWVFDCEGIEVEEVIE